MSTILQSHGASFPATTSLTASLNLTGSALTCFSYDNTGATTDITLTLPAATVGKRARLAKTEQRYNFFIDVQFSDVIEGQPNGVDLALLGRGFVELACVQTGIWSIIAQAGHQQPRYFGNTRQLYMKLPADGGSDAANGESWATAKATIKGIYQIARPGDVINIAPGTYTGTDNQFTNFTVPFGNPDAWITFRCRTTGDVDSPFGAVFETLTLNVSDLRAVRYYGYYVKFENLVWKSNTAKVIRGKWMYFTKCGFIDGVTTAGANSSVCAIGSSWETEFDTSDILLEDCVAFGSGGRYRFLIYGATRVIGRRCVARWDQGWDDNGGGWQAADFGLYDAPDCEWQNCISIDDLAPANYPQNYKGAMFLEQNYWDASNMAYRGCIVVNNQGPAFVADSLTSNAVAYPPSDVNSGSVYRKMRVRNWLIENCAAAKVLSPTVAGQGAISVGIGPLSVENCTVADLNRADGKSFRTTGNIPDKWHHGSRFVNNVSVYGAAGGAGHFDLHASVFNDNNLGYSSIAAAQAAGLYHLPFARYSGSIAVAGAGAEILKKFGRVNSVGRPAFYGEPAYRALGDGATTGDLWPFPNEANIKTLFVTHGGAARGWISTAKTLTQYIWEILGTAAP